MGSELEPLVAMTHIGAVDASGSPYHNVFVAPCACVITGARLVQAKALATAATGNATYTLTNVTDSKTVGILSTDSAAAAPTALATDTAVAFTLVSTASQLELDAGDVIQMLAEEADTATTGDLTEAAVAIFWVPGTGVGQ
jgi:hypothetical protein